MTSIDDFIAPNVTMAKVVVALVSLVLLYPFLQWFLVSRTILDGVKE